MGQCQGKYTTTIPCAICGGEMDNENEVIKTKCCKNRIHDKCIRDWAFQNPTCPFCRSSFKVDLKPETINKIMQMVNDKLINDGGQMKLINNPAKISDENSRITFYDNNGNNIQTTNNIGPPRYENVCIDTNFISYRACD